MVLIKSCCFLKSLRSGCLLSAIYSLIFYTLVLTASTFHIHEVINDRALFAFTITMVTMSVTIIITSILLIIAIYGDNKHLMIPWMVMITVTTAIDIAFSSFLLITEKLNPFLLAMHTVDLFICALNIYCLFCGISQYQIYSHQLFTPLTRGRGQCEGQESHGLRHNGQSESDNKINCIVTDMPTVDTHTNTISSSNSVMRDPSSCGTSTAM